MVEIHNIDIKIPIYFKDECIGICTSLISFIDVKTQIYEQNLTGYFFEFKGIKYEFNPKKFRPDNIADGWYEDLYTDFLVRIIKVEFNEKRTIIRKF